MASLSTVRKVTRCIRPLTDVAIGGYTLATVICVRGALALLVGLVGGVLSALTGLADLLAMERGTTAFRTGVYHGSLMATATTVFLLAAVFQYDGFHDGEVTTAGLVLVLAGWLVMSAGGALGGALVFRHGVRVSAEDR